MNRGTVLLFIYEQKNRPRVHIVMCFLCLNPEVSPFILIVTDDATYVFGTADPTVTHTIYNSVVEQLS